jgi:hypothetical protein
MFAAGTTPVWPNTTDLVKYQQRLEGKFGYTEVKTSMAARILPSDVRFAFFTDRTSDSLSTMLLTWGQRVRGCPSLGGNVVAKIEGEAGDSKTVSQVSQTQVRHR